jgi:ATP-dependent Lon protease
MPKKNAKDLEEVPKKVLRDMTLVQATEMDEVLKTALARMPEPVKLKSKPRSTKVKRLPTKRIKR